MMSTGYHAVPSLLEQTTNAHLYHLLLSKYPALGDSHTRSSSSVSSGHFHFHQSFDSPSPHTMLG